MLTIHTIRAGKHVILPQKEFSLLIQNLLKTQEIEVIEKFADDIETEEDRIAYMEALEELEHHDTIDFNELKPAWLQGKSAGVQLTA